MYYLPSKYGSGWTGRKFSRKDTIQMSKSMYEPGKTYQTYGGYKVLIRGICSAGTDYETVYSRNKWGVEIHRYNRRDYGRCTGSASGNLDSRNLIPLVQVREAIPLPKWAERTIEGNYKHIRAVLPTRDGRVVGNAINAGTYKNPDKGLPAIYIVISDAGNILYLSEREMCKMFHPPQYVSKDLLPAHSKALENQKKK